MVAAQGAGGWIAGKALTTVGALVVLGMSGGIVALGPFGAFVLRDEVRPRPRLRRDPRERARSAESRPLRLEARGTTVAVANRWPSRLLSAPGNRTPTRVPATRTSTLGLVQRPLQRPLQRLGKSRGWIPYHGRVKELRLVCISDTHGRHGELDLPPGDVLVHAGDFCSRGTLDEARAFTEWLRDQAFAHKVVVAGNHDRLFESDPDLARSLVRDAHYLQDSGAEVAGLRFWGSPWQPEYGGWAFNLPLGEPLADRWNQIPRETQVLVTHCPPKGVLDRIHSGLSIGCPDLQHALERVQPGLHVFGHVHEQAGVALGEGRLSVNAANCNLHYRLGQPPIVVDWNGSSFRTTPELERA